MKKYGVFYAGTGEPYQTFEGDSISQDKQYVEIFKDVQSSSGMPGSTQVAAIKLSDGGYVKEVD
jgi:hypothetical protein